PRASARCWSTWPPAPPPTRCPRAWEFRNARPATPCRKPPQRSAPKTPPRRPPGPARAAWLPAGADLPRERRRRPGAGRPPRRAGAALRASGRGPRPGSDRGRALVASRPGAYGERDVRVLDAITTEPPAVSVRILIF